MHKAKIVITFFAFLAIGYVTGKHWNTLSKFIVGPTYVYSAKLKTTTNDDFERITWQDLIPEAERTVLEQYQSNDDQSLDGLTNQILNSINAASDSQYQAALNSFNTVTALNRKAVKIDGFVVPISFHPNKDVKTLFIVPYFGACIHFPPPAPNQMIFAELDEGFTENALEQAFSFTGVLNIELYEDMLGSSAYTLDVKAISIFSGQPDTFRNHASN